MKRSHPILDFFRHNAREKAMAFGLSFALWITVVYRSQVVHRDFGVPFQFSLLGNQLMVTHTNPPEAKVTLSGPRANFTLLEPREIKLILNLEEARVGQRAYRVNRTDIIVPNGLSLDDIVPRQVRLRIVERAAETNGEKGEANSTPAPAPAK